MLGAAVYSRSNAQHDSDSLLTQITSGEVVSEGPLDPSAYAQGLTPGVGGARLAAADGGLGVDIITFSDPEVSFASQLGGTAVQAPLSPILIDPKDLDKSDQSSTNQTDSKVYTVQSGDTIASIAEQHDISVDTILWANGLSSSDTLSVGDHLTLLPTSGVLHTVKSGDTLLAIANAYDIDALEIKKFNNLEDSHKLSIGQKLIVPGGKVAPRVAPSIRDTRVAVKDDGPTPQPQTPSGSGFIWPTTTKHISQYFRWGHTGIDIDNRSRPPLYAAEAGTVEFAGWLGGYGNLLIINHGGGLQTYYAHNEKHYVAKGEAVTKGQAIAKMGSTGRSTGPHVHFEVRKNGQPINPLGMY